MGSLGTHGKILEHHAGQVEERDKAGDRAWASQVLEARLRSFLAK